MVGCLIYWVYIPVYCMVGRGRHLTERSRSDVIAHRFDHGRNCGGEHSHERRSADRWRPPLSCSEKRKYLLHYTNNHVDISTTKIFYCIIALKILTILCNFYFHIC